MGVEEAHAGADLAVPADEGRSLVDEPAAPGVDGDPVAHEGQVLETLEQAEKRLLGRVVDVDARQAELGLARGEGERFEGQRLEAKHFFFHRLAVRQDVADEDAARADRPGQAVEVLDIAEVRLHDDEGDADLDPVTVPSVGAAEAFDVLEDEGEARPLADRLEALFGRPVEGDPEHVEALPEEAPDQGRRGGSRWSSSRL